MDENEKLVARFHMTDAIPYTKRLKLSEVNVELLQRSLIMDLRVRMPENEGEPILSGTRAA